MNIIQSKQILLGIINYHTPSHNHNDEYTAIHKKYSSYEYIFLLFYFWLQVLQFYFQLEF